MAEKANTKTNTRGRKPATKTIKEEVIEEVKEVEKEPVKKVEKKTKKTFDQEEGVLCRSVTEGLLLVGGPKTGMTYRFTDYGVEQDIEYRDLVAIVRSKFQYIDYPYFVILDDDFIEEFPQVKRFYEDNYPLDDLRSVLKEPIDTMIEIIEKLPKGAVDSLKNMIATDVSLGQINEIDRLNALNKFYGVDFLAINEVFGEG